MGLDDEVEVIVLDTEVGYTKRRVGGGREGVDERVEDGALAQRANHRERTQGDMDGVASRFPPQPAWR